MIDPNWKPEGYKSEMTITDEYKISLLARMLAGYDEQTWQKLRSDRKRTYLRAASSVLYEFGDFEKIMAEWK